MVGGDATKEYHRLMHLQDKDEVIPTNLTQFLRQKEELLDLADERVRQLKVSLSIIYRHTVKLVAKLIMHPFWGVFMNALVY